MSKKKRPSKKQMDTRIEKMLERMEVFRVNTHLTGKKIRHRKGEG